MTYAWLAAAIAECAWGVTNIAPLSVIRSSPYVGASIAYLVDGRVGPDNENTLMLAAPLPIRIGQVMPMQYEFAFPGRRHVARIRMFQYASVGRRPASAFVFELDTQGDGRYSTVVVNERNGRGGHWVEYELSPSMAAYGLRFRTTAFPTYGGPNYGAPAVGEIEILVDESSPPASAAPAPDVPFLVHDAMAGTPLVKRASDVQGRQFQRGLVGSMWLFWSAGKEYDEQANSRSIDVLKRLKVNRYWLNPGIYVPSRTDLPFLTLPQNPDYRHFIDRQFEDRARSGSSEMKILPFPSAVAPGNKENVLRPFVAQMHRNGIGVIVNQFLLPYGLGSWDFPRVMNPRVYPCVLSSSFVRDASTTLYREFMESGVDGLALGGDEYFVHNHTGVGESASPVCRDGNGLLTDACAPTCNELFKQKFGLGHTSHQGVFSPLQAKWKSFEYEELGTLFSGYAGMMKSVNPNSVVTSLFRAGEENRPAYGVAYDVMGATGNVTVMSSNPYWSHNSYLGHFYFANETKKLAGASRNRTAVVTLQPTPNFDRNGFARPIMLYGPALSALMHGARGINFYEQNYLFAGGRNDAGPWVEKIFNLTAFLETKGLLDFHVPKAIALLYSRASEDWWQLGHEGHPIEAAEAILFQNAVMEVLFRHGIPFDLFYLDQPSSLEDISKYQEAIVAYPYSIGKDAAARVHEAARNGTRVVSLQRMGEVDEFAEPHQRPLLQGAPGIEHLAIDIGRSNYNEFSARLLPVIMKNLAGAPPLTLSADGKDVECSVLENGDRRLVFCLNWEDRPVEINLGIHLRKGTYSVSMITMDSETPARINGNASLKDSDLGSFRLGLEGGNAVILSITPQLAGRSSH